MSRPDPGANLPPTGLRHGYPSYPQPKNIIRLGPVALGPAGKPPKELLVSVTYPAQRPVHRAPPAAPPSPFWRQATHRAVPTPPISLPGPLRNPSVLGVPVASNPWRTRPAATPPVHRPPHWRPPPAPIPNPVTRADRLTNITAMLVSARDAVVRHNPHLVRHPHFGLGTPPPPTPTIIRVR